jgi:hypothetical protein
VIEVRNLDFSAWVFNRSVFKLIIYAKHILNINLTGNGLVAKQAASHDRDPGSNLRLAADIFYFYFYCSPTFWPAPWLLDAPSFPIIGSCGPKLQGPLYDQSSVLFS